MAKQLNKSIANGNRINFQIGFNADKSSLNDIQQSLSLISKMTQSDLMDINKGLNLSEANTQLKEIRETVTTVRQALINSFNKDLGTVNITKFNSELSKTGLNLQQVYTTLAKAGTKGQNAFRNLTTELLTTQMQLKKTHSVLEDMANTMSNTIKWSIASSFMNNFSGSIQKAFNFVKNLDTSLNNIRIVTGKSSNEMAEFAKEANAAAKALDAQTTTYSDAALIYYQQGLNAEQSASRAATTVKVSNVTGMSGDEASEALTAVWNGYQVSEKNTELYVDKLAKVAAGTAADLEELSTGMSKVASAANTAGVDVDQLNATLATVISVTREAPETIGTAFKTIYARLGDLALDGQDEYGVTLGTVSGQMEELGIQILDEQGNMRDMGDIIEDTAEKWNTWTQAQKQAAAVAMAGKMQYSRLISLFENWDMYEKALNMSKDAVGELDKEQAIYADSTQAHLKQVQAAWEGVYNSIFTGEDVNDVLDTLVPIINQVEDLVNILGNSKGILLTLGSTALTVFKDQIGSSLSTTIMNLKAVNSNAKQLENQFKLLQNLKGIGIDNSATNDIIKMREELLKYSHLLTEDQQNQAVAFINTRNELEKEKDAIINAESEVSKFFSQRTNMTSADTSTFSRNEEGIGTIDFNNGKGGLKDSDVYAGKIEKIDQAMKSYEKTLNEVTKAENEYNKAQAAEDSGTGNNDQTIEAFNKYKAAVKQLREEMARLADSEYVLEDETAALVKSYKEFDKELESFDGAGEAYDELSDQINNMKKTFSTTVKTIKKESEGVKSTLDKNMEKSFQAVTEKITNFKKQFKDFKEELNLGNIISGITGTIGGFGQFASVIQTSINLLKGVKDGTYDFVDVLSTLPIIVGQISSGFNNFNSAFKVFSDGSSILEAMKGQITQINIARSEGMKKLDEEAIKTKANAAAKEAAEAAKAAREKANLALKEAEKIADEKAAAVKARLITAEEAELATKEANTKAAAEEIVAKEAETAATTAQTAAQWANNAAWYAHPIVFIAAAIVAATAVITGLTIAIISNSRAQEKANALEKEKQDLAEKSKVADKAREESEAIRQLAEQYNDLYKQYEKSTISKDNMKEKAFELVDAYGDESLAVLALTEDYEGLKTAIEKVQEEKNKKTIESSQAEQSSIQKTMAADIRKNRKESEIDKDSGGVSGWSIDLKGTNGINSKAENKLIKNLSKLKTSTGQKIDIGEGTGHISLEGFITQATENEDKLREILENSETDAAKQLLSILEDEKDYIDRYSNSVTEMQTAQKENLGMKSKNALLDTLKKDKENAEKTSGDLVRDYQKKLSEMASEAINKGLFEDTDEGEKAARKWAESYLSGISDELSEYAKITTLSDKITSSVQDKFKSAIQSNVSDQLKTKGVNTSNKKVKKEISSVSSDASKNATRELTLALQELDSEQLTAIAANKNYTDQLMLMWKATGSAQEAVEKYANAVSSTKNEQLDLSENTKTELKQLEKTETGFQGYAKYLQKNNKYLKDNKELTEDVALRQVELGTALSKCVDHWEEWMDQLEECDKGTIDYYDTLGEMADAFSGVFGVDLSTDFIEKNLTDLKALINGDVDAFDRLQVAAAKDYVANMTIIGNDEEINTLRTKLNSFIDEYNGREVGTTLTADAKPLIDTLNNALKAGQMTEEQMNEYLSGIGYKGKVSYIEAPGPTTTSTISAKILGKNMKLGTVKTTSKVKIPQIDSITKTNASVSSVSSPTKNTVRSATQGSNEVDDGGGGSDPQIKDLNEDKSDPYEKVNIQLEKIEANLKKIQSQEDKLMGQKLVDNLNQQLEVLNKKIDKTNEKLKIAQKEQSRLQGILSGYGIGFDSEGIMTNYAEVFDRQQAALNAVYNHYNSLSADAQKGYEATVTAAEKRWEKFKDAVSDYDTLVGSTIPGLEQDIQDTMDEKLEIQIKEFDMSIDLTLDIKDAQDKWNDFKKKIIKDLKDTNILGNALDDLERFADYYNEQGLGVIQQEVDHLNKLMGEVDKYNNTGWSTVYGDDQSSMMEDLKKYYEQAMDDLESVKDLIDDIHDKMNETLEDIADQMDDQMNYYEAINDTLDHDMQLVQLVYGEEAYDRLALYYEQMEKNLNGQLEFQKASVDFWQAQMDSLEKGSEEWKTAKENWLNAVKDWQGSVETAIENLSNKYLNTINEIFQELNNKVTNGNGLDYMNTEWELIKKNADEYLDTINTAYGIQQLQNKYLDAIDSTKSITAQQKLNKLMKEQINALKQQDKLTQYDLDRAELKYQIAVKRIALEEAQQNKSTMRLRRDSQGNYSYQYVADEDQVSKAQQEVSDLYNQLYNLDVDQYQSNLDKVYEIWAEYQEKMKEAAQINDAEARLKKEQLLTEQYGQLINGLVSQNETIKQGLYESTFLELEDLYGKQSETVENFLQNQDDMMSLLIAGWSSGLQEMADEIKKEGGFEATYEESLEKIKESTQQYEEELKNLQDIANVSFDSLGKDVDDVQNKIQSLTGDTNSLINKFTQEVQSIQDVMNQIDALNDMYQRQSNAIQTVVNAYNKYIQAMNNARNAATQASNSVSGNGGSGNSGSSNGGNSGSSSPYTGYPLGGQTYTVVKGDNLWNIAKKKYGNASQWPTIYNNNRSVIGGNPNRIYPGQVLRLDTGGYTGAWGTEGRMAMLHEKELVLNKKDTENMLNAVEILRNITSTLDTNMLVRLANISASSYNGIGESSPLQQEVHIDATFPNVSNHNEIEDALNNLVNAAAQRVGKKR